MPPSRVVDETSCAIQQGEARCATQQGGWWRATQLGGGVPPSRVMNEAAIAAQFTRPTPSCYYRVRLMLLLLFLVLVVDSVVDVGIVVDGAAATVGVVAVRGRLLLVVMWLLTVQ